MNEENMYEDTGAMIDKIYNEERDRKAEESYGKLSEEEKKKLSFDYRSGFNCVKCNTTIRVHFRSSMEYICDNCLHGKLIKSVNEIEKNTKNPYLFYRNPFLYLAMKKTNPAGVIKKHIPCPPHIQESMNQNRNKQENHF